LGTVEIQDCSPYSQSIQIISGEGLNDLSGGIERKDTGKEFQKPNMLWTRDI